MEGGQAASLPATWLRQRPPMLPQSGEQLQTPGPQNSLSCLHCRSARCSASSSACWAWFFIDLQKDLFFFFFFLIFFFNPVFNNLSLLHPVGPRAKIEHGFLKGIWDPLVAPECNRLPRPMP